MDFITARYEGRQHIHVPRQAPDRATRWSSILGPPIVGVLSTGTPPLELADLDGDGVLDLCAASIYRPGLGGGAFGSGISYAPLIGGLQSSILAYKGVKDLDGDSDLDLALLDGPILTNVRRQLIRGAWAVPGGTATLDVYGPPGAPVELFAASRLAPEPFDLPGWGIVRVDPALAFSVGPNMLDATGRATYPVAIPNLPSLVGFTVFWQTAMPSLPVLTGAEALTVIPQ